MPSRSHEPTIRRTPGRAPGGRNPHAPRSGERHATICRAGVALLLSAAAFTAHADAPYLPGIHWYGDAADTTVEQMTGNRAIWALEIVQTNSDIWWGAEWQRDNRFNAMAQRGHSIIVRIERNWGETVAYPENLAAHVAAVTSAAQALASVCHVWQIGNEMNILGEWGGQPLAPAYYASVYAQLRAAIKSVPSPLGEQIVLVGPVSPGDAIPGVRHTGGLEYLEQVCTILAPDQVDGFALHAYAAPWNDLATSRGEFQAGYLSQLAVLRHYGFGGKPVHITEWARQVDPINATSEATSAQFLSGALADMAAWNQRDGGHPIRSASWFIYAYDAGAWSGFSIEYLRTLHAGGPANDLWDAMQFACAQEHLGAAPPPGAVNAMTAGVPSGVNVAIGAAAWASSGNAALAIDGIVSVASKWTSASSPVGHTATVDLGRVRSLTGIRVRMPAEAGEPAAYNARTLHLETADAPDGPWHVAWMGVGTTGATPLSLVFNGPRAARFVRVVVSDPGIDAVARIPEIEIYARPVVGDYNGTGAVDGEDLDFLDFCMQGPEITYPAGQFCLDGDGDADADVDLADLAAMQADPGG